MRPPGILYFRPNHACLRQSASRERFKSCSIWFTQPCSVIFNDESVCLFPAFRCSVGNMDLTLFLHIPVWTLLARYTPGACIPLGSFGGSGVGSPLLLQPSGRYKIMQCAFPILSNPRWSLLGTDVAAPVSGRLHWGCTYESTYSWMTGYSIFAHWSARPIPPGVSSLPARWCGPGVYWCFGTTGSRLRRVLLWTSQPPVGHWWGTGKIKDLALYYSHFFFFFYQEVGEPSVNRSSYAIMVEDFSYFYLKNHFNQRLTNPRQFSRPNCGLKSIAKERLVNLFLRLHRGIVYSLVLTSGPGSYI